MGGEIREPPAAEAMSALRWWLEVGVDAAIQESSRNWLKPAGPAQDAPLTKVQADPASLDSMPDSFDLFRTWLGSASPLPHSASGAKRVLPRGGEAAPVMLLSEMPALEDAAAEQPIGGEAWLLMKRMLAAIGIQAEEAYSASLSCLHSPAAKLSASELDACAVIARRHISLAKPRRLLLLGDAPVRALLGKSLIAARGHVHQVEGVRTVATQHPRLLLDQGARKAEAWKDLLLLMEDEV